MSPRERKPEPDRHPGVLYTIDSQPAPARRAYWREALSRTFGAVQMTVADEVRTGRIQAQALGRLRAVTVDSDSQSAQRTPRLVAQSDQDDYMVVKLLDRGTARLEQDGREAYLEPGDIFLYDMARPVRLTFPQPFRTKSLILPKNVLGLRESEAVRVTAAPVGRGTPLAGLLSPFLSGMVDAAAAYPPRTGEVMARNVVELLGVLTDEMLGRPSAETPGGNQAMLLRIQDHIDRHLADPELSPRTIAQAHHISLRYLHKLFEGEDVSVGRWIQRRRLENCRRDLLRTNVSSITAVANLWGFSSGAHFSKAFRAAYGMSPREWRENAVSL